MGINGNLNIPLGGGHIKQDQRGAPVAETTTLASICVVGRPQVAFLVPNRGAIELKLAEGQIGGVETSKLLRDGVDPGK
jgi:hypothetical protein